MIIQVNGKQQELGGPGLLQDLIDQLGLSDKRIAVEVNLEIVPRSQYREHQLSEGDQVEIVHAIGGGEF